MNKRKLPLGEQNMIGERVTKVRTDIGLNQKDMLAKLHLAGIEMSIPALSLLEGRKRTVSDFELCALADILNVSVDWLLGRV